MRKHSAGASREETRAHLVEVAANLLATQGPDAVTTRSVALAAGVQAPTIYRLFGDKSGLLDAVMEQGFASYLADKHPVAADADPVQGLRRGWELHVGFGVANPELFRLMHTALRTPGGRTAAAAGAGVLQARVHRVAVAGRLRVTERRAIELIQAAGTGVIFTLIDQRETQPEDRIRGERQGQRDDTLADTAWQAVCATILTDASTAAVTGPVAAAVTLRAALPDLVALTVAERALLGDWLNRIAESSAPGEDEGNR